MRIIQCKQAKQRKNRKLSVKCDTLKRKSKTQRGKGLINKIIDKLPFELHVPSYQYCGPGDCKHFLSDKKSE